MFFPEIGVRVWLYTQPTDMRKSYDGLSALVKNKRWKALTIALCASTSVIIILPAKPELTDDYSHSP